MAAWLRVRRLPSSCRVRVPPMNPSKIPSTNCLTTSVTKTPAATPSPPARANANPAKTTAIGSLNADSHSIKSINRFGNRPAKGRRRTKTAEASVLATMAPMNRTRGRVAGFVPRPLAALSPNPAHPIKAAVMTTPTVANRAAGLITSRIAVQLVVRPPKKRTRTREA